jgi:hypothetical protein
MVLKLIDFYSKELSNGNFYPQFLKKDNRKRVITLITEGRMDKPFDECIQEYRNQEVKEFLNRYYNREDLQFILNQLKNKSDDSSKWNYILLGFICSSIFNIMDNLFKKPLELLTSIPVVLFVVLIAGLIIIYKVTYTIILSTSLKGFIFTREAKIEQLTEIIEDLILEYNKESQTI